MKTLLNSDRVNDVIVIDLPTVTAARFEIDSQFTRKAAPGGGKMLKPEQGQRFNPADEDVRVFNNCRIEGHDGKLFCIEMGQLNASVGFVKDADGNPGVKHVDGQFMSIDENTIVTIRGKEMVFGVAN